MPVRVDEPIAVTLSPDGEPRSFIWRQFEYEVFGVPLAFFRRRSWWREQENEQRGSQRAQQYGTQRHDTDCLAGDPATGADLTRIDHELWRVEASATGLVEDARTYDISRFHGEDVWRLILSWE